MGPVNDERTIYAFVQMGAQRNCVGFTKALYAL